MKIRVLYVIAWLSGFVSVGQPSLDNLKLFTEGAHEIVLTDETRFTIKRIDQSSLSRKYMSCILDKYASNSNTIKLYYDDFQEIESVKISVLDSDLNEIKSYKLKDLQDYSANGSSMATDNRIKYLKINERRFPYFITVEYSINYSGSLFYPRWIAQEDEKLSVVSSKFVVESFLDHPFRYKSNIPASDSINEPNHYLYEWAVDSLPAYTYKSYSYDIEDYSPSVMVAPGKFQMNGIVGDLSSWKSFGEWIDGLNNTQNTLTDADKQQIMALVNPDDTPLQKTKKIYQYLQQNTRYVSIQLGIGGWKPFESRFVHTNKYGDCKALSFYTKSLLEVVGIKSYYTLIKAGPGTSAIKADFPNAHFNHAILTVPMETDTLWLECTSQTNPFGYLGTNTSDRDALLIDGANSKIIHTRSYKTEENTQRTVVNMTIDKNGVGACKVRRNFSGIEVENDGFMYVVDKTEKEKSDWFVDNHQWGDVKLHDLSISKIEGSEVPHGSMEANLEISNSASLMGRRMFFNPFLFTNIDYINVKEAERKVPMEIRYPYTQIDTVQVTFDQFFHPERPISDNTIKSDFGEYSVKVIRKENNYTFIRTFTLHKGQYNPSIYPQLKEFIESVQKSDRQKLVMINKT